MSECLGYEYILCPEKILYAKSVRRVSQIRTSCVVWPEKSSKARQAKVDTRLVFRPRKRIQFAFKLNLTKRWNEKRVLWRQFDAHSSIHNKFELVPNSPNEIPEQKFSLNMEKETTLYRFDLLFFFGAGLQFHLETSWASSCGETTTQIGGVILTRKDGLCARFLLPIWWQELHLFTPVTNG